MPTPPLPPPGPYEVHLAAAGNPDHRQDPDRPPYGCEAARWQRCGTLRQARLHCEQFIARNDLGGGNWTGGEVRPVGGPPFARFSYNGRLWAGPGHQCGHEIVIP